MKTTLRWFLVPIFAGIALVAVGKERSYFLSPADEQALEAAEPPPPADDSVPGQADLAEVMGVQAHRTAAEIAEAKLDESYSAALFDSAVGYGFTKDHDPVTFALLGKVNEEIRGIVVDSKKHWHRERPFTRPGVHPLFTAGDFSYPSGHSTHAFAFAVILGALVPERAEACLARARLIAQSRVTAGVHYPTDIHEGETLGKAIAAALLANPEFQTELKAAQAEIAATK